MLDPHFKSLQIIQNHMGLEVVVQIVTKYHCEVLILILLTIYNKLTSTPFIVEPLHVLPKLGVFGSLTSRKKATMGLLKDESSLYRQITMPSETFNLLNWWAEHEQQFPNVGFFACQFMGIVGF